MQPHGALGTMPMPEDRLSAPCPKCRAEMIYVAALPHPQSPTMQKTTFVCYSCNQTRNYALSEEMAKAYASAMATRYSTFRQNLSPITFMNADCGLAQLCPNYRR